MSINQRLSVMVAAGLLSLTADVARAGMNVSVSPTSLAPPAIHPSVLVHHARDDKGGNTSLPFMANRKVDENKNSESAAQRRTAPAHAQAPVDFNHPPRDYASHRLHGWDVLVEMQLVEEAPELATNALGRLEAKLGEIARLLPTNSLPDLRRLRVFLLHGPRAKTGGRSNGLEYFAADAPKHHDWLDARMASSIVIFNAENWVKLTEHWALKALVHEFGHAQHLEHWREDRADIFDTWQAATKAGLYQVVREEDKGTHFPNYAAQNHLEYFAELTAMYFVGAHYFPKDRAGLKAYDPEGYALVEKLWGVHAPPPASTRAGENK